MDNTRIMACCILSFQKARSIIMESTGYDVMQNYYELAIIDPFLFNEDTENLISLWEKKKPVQAIDVFNAIAWIQYRSLPWWFEFQGYMDDAGLSKYIGNPILVLGDKK